MAKDCEQILFQTFERDGVYQIQCSGLVPGPGHVYATLIVGQQRGLLVDNGFGDDDFWPYLRELTDKPITVVATHGHPDHIGGALQFDHLWLAQEDTSALDMIFGSGSYDAALQTLAKQAKLSYLTDGQVFELGGRTVTAIHTPGHTWGSYCFYDDQTQIMLTGDTLNRHVFLFTDTVPIACYKESLNHLLEYPFDIFLGGHHPEPFAREWVGKMLKLLEDFSPDKAVPYLRPDMPGFEKVNVMKVAQGRGYGDPNYIAFMYCAAQLETE